MPERPVPVQWEVAEDELFRHVVARGTQLAQPDSAHVIGVETQGLRPGREAVRPACASGASE